ncbi:MAG: tetratricopeptide repeat protein [Piscinibacter sp.]|nr:tetratricopeptide repeat protein [Piscinibacter sp.]
MSPLIPVTAVAAALLVLAPAHAETTCYDFGNQAPGTTWAVDPAVAVPISIGQIRVRPLISSRPSPSNQSVWIRLVRRNRLPVGAAAAVGVALVVGAGLAVWQAAQARAEQRRAEAVKDFVTGLFTDADPFATRSGTPTVEALLETARMRLAEADERDPALRVELLDMLGRSLIGIGQFDRAESVLAKAVDEGRQLLGPQHRLTLRARVSMTSVQRFRGQQEAMKAELAEIVPVLRAAGAPARADLYAAITNQAHAAIDGGRYAEAKAAAQEALALAGQLFGPRHQDTASAALMLANVEQYGGDPANALQAAQHARDLLLQVHGSERLHARVLDGRFVYGRALGNVGAYTQAVAELSAVLQGVRTLLGAQAPMAGFVAADIARYQFEIGDAAGSLEHAVLALRIVSGVAQEQSTTVGMARVHVGRAQLALYRAAEARASLGTARDTMQALRGAEHPLVVDLAVQTALADAYTGRVGEAWQAIQALLPAVRAGPEASFRWRGLHIAGIVRRLAGAFDDAELLQREALAAVPDLPVHAPRRAAARAEQARLALELGRAGEALEILRGLAPLEAASPARAERWLTEGRALLALGRRDEALPLLTRADAFWQQHDPGSTWARDAATWKARAAAS